MKYNAVEKCKGCKCGVIQRNYIDHITKCDQFVIECLKCKIKMTKAAMK